MFRFINLIKIELKRSKFLELFGLTLNVINIGTPKIRTSIGNTKLFKVLFLGVFFYFSKSDYNKNLVASKFIAIN